MQHAVGQHEVDQGIHVHPEVEVLPVIPGEPRRDPVVVEQHGGHTVKAEAIKAVLLNEPAEEMADFYENDTEWREWEGGPTVEYDTP